MKHVCQCCGVQKHGHEFTRNKGVYDLTKCKSCKTLARARGEDPLPPRQAYRECANCGQEKHYRAFKKGSDICIGCQNDDNPNCRIRRAPEKMPTEFSAWLRSSRGKN